MLFRRLISVAVDAEDTLAGRAEVDIIVTIPNFAIANNVEAVDLLFSKLFFGALDSHSMSASISSQALSDAVPVACSGIHASDVAIRYVNSILYKI